MKETGRLFRANEGDVIEVYPANGKKFELTELQKFVGGYIELVPGTAKRGKPQTFCNEEGRLKGLPVNPRASFEFGTTLVGDVLQVVKAKAAAK